MDKNIDKEINIFEYFAPSTALNLTNFPNLINSKKVWGLGIKIEDGGLSTDGTTNARNFYKSWANSFVDDLLQFTQYYGYYILNNPGTSPYVLYNETSALPYKKNIKYQYQIAMFRGDGRPPSDTAANTAPVTIDASLPFILNNKIKTIFGVSSTGRAWISWNGIGKPNSLKQLIPGESYIFVSIITPPNGNTVNWVLYDFPTPTATASPTPTPTPTPTISPTPGPSPTATATPGPSPTATDAPSPSPTATANPLATTPTATATPTATPVSFDGILSCGDSGSAAGEQCISCTSSGCNIQLDVDTVPRPSGFPFPYMTLRIADGLGTGREDELISATVSWNAGSSPSVFNDAKLQGKVTVTYYGTTDNFNLGSSKVVQSTPIGFDWNTAPAACSGGGSGIVCTTIDSNMLLSNFSITPVPGGIYYFLLEIDIEDCAGYKAVSNRRVGDFLSACNGYEVDYNGDTADDACRDCVCRPGVYEMGCPQSGSDGAHPSGRNPCGMFVVYT
jgi:hypothetical protein